MQSIIQMGSLGIKTKITERGDRRSNMPDRYPTHRWDGTYFLPFTTRTKEMATIWHCPTSQNAREQGSWKDTTQSQPAWPLAPPTNNPTCPIQSKRKTVTQMSFAKTTYWHSRKSPPDLSECSIGTAPKLAFLVPVTHRKLRTKAGEQRGSLRKGRRLEREETTGSKRQQLLVKADPGTQRHSCLQHLDERQMGPHPPQAWEHVCATEPSNDQHWWQI